MIGSAFLTVLALAPPARALTPAPSACGDGERVRLVCRVKGGKVGRFCQTKAGMTYTFGALGAPPELSLDQTAVSERQTGPDSEQLLFWATNAVEGEGTWRYVAVVDRTEDQFESRLVVEKNGAAVATLPCRDPVQADLTEIEPLAKTLGTGPSGLTAWAGRWERTDGNAELTLSAAANGLAVQGMATLPIYETIHVAELQGTFRPAVDGQLNALTLKAHCTVDLRWAAPGAITVVDSKNCGGHNVTFDGDYRRVY